MGVALVCAVSPTSYRLVLHLCRCVRVSTGRHEDANRHELLLLFYWTWSDL